MKLSAELKCECGTKNKVTFKKPDWFTHTTGTYICDGCESRLQYYIKKGKKKFEANVVQKVLDPSDDLLLMRIEEANAKAMNQEAP